MKKVFKIHTNKLFGLTVESTRKTSKVARVLFLICFHTGNVIYKWFVSFASRLERQIARTKITTALRYKLIKQPKFARSLLIFFGACLGAGLLLQSLQLIAQGLTVKQQVLDSAIAGQANLLSAKQDLSSEKFSAAQDKFLMAYKNFNSSAQQLNQTSQQFYYLLDLLPQKQDADKVLSAASTMAKAGGQAVTLLQTASSLKISAEGISSQGDTAAVLTSIKQQLDQIISELQTAQTQVVSVNENSLPASYRQTFLETKQKMQNLSGAFGNISDIFNLLQSMLVGKKNVLVLFENSNELRASGGFMGTFGNFTLTDGKIENIKISSIYDLDGQLKEKILPPQPILNVNDRWYMRDANWFADFPHSAKAVSNFYEKEGGQTPDLIVAISANYIVDLLKTLGPVQEPNYKLNLNADNFMEQMQAAATIDRGQNNPKAVLGDFFTLLMGKISPASSDQLSQVLATTQTSLNGKEIAFFSPWPDLQQQFVNFNWAGQVLASDRDYLAIVGSNLGGTKTDLYINQKIELSTVISSDGTLVDHLKITRTNTLPNLPDMENTSFLRVLVPAGSQLTAESGFEPKTLPNVDKTGYQISDAVLDWEKNSSSNVVSGTITGQEAEKTFFGNWQTLKGGETKTITLDYRLPFSLSSIDHYSLLLQKQMGAKASEFDYSLNLGDRKIEWKNFDTDTLNADSLTTHFSLDKDSLLGLVLSPSSR